MSEYELYNADCMDVMDFLSNVDLVLTDLPYGTTQCKWDSIIPLDTMGESINNVTYDTTPILLFGTEPFSSHLRMSNLTNFRYDWIWHKNMSGSFALAKKMPMKYHEIISVFYKRLPTYNPQFQDYSDSMKQRFRQGETVNRTKQLEHSTNNIHGGLSLNPSPVDFKRGKYPESVQFFKGVHTANGNRVHPSQKPVELLEYFIRTYTNEGDTVLDFTMGSGSTGVASMNTNRNFIGIELEEEYYTIANKRIRNANKSKQTTLAYWEGNE